MTKTVPMEGKRETVNGGINCKTSAVNDSEEKRGRQQRGKREMSEGVINSKA